MCVGEGGGQGEGFDLVFGSDIVYEPKCFNALVLSIYVSSSSYSCILLLHMF